VPGHSLGTTTEIYAHVAQNEISEEAPMALNMAEENSAGAWAATAANTVPDLRKHMSAQDAGRERRTSMTYNCLSAIARWA
jgi:hypothetical protein